MSGAFFFAQYRLRMYNQKLTKISVKKVDLFTEKIKLNWLYN